MSKEARKPRKALRAGMPRRGRKKVSFYQLERLILSGVVRPLRPSIEDETCLRHQLYID
jgi:hypothetical protein